MLASRSSRTQCFVDHKNLNWMGNFKITFLGQVHTSFTKYRHLLCVLWVCVCYQNDGKNLPCHTDEEHCEVFPKFCPMYHAEKVIKGQNLCSLLPVCRMGSDVAGLLTGPSMPLNQVTQAVDCSSVNTKPELSCCHLVPLDFASVREHVASWRVVRMKDMKAVLCFLCPWLSGEMAPINLWDLN